MSYSDLVTTEDRDGLYGVYVAIVSDIEDPENLARVKVTFPWRDADDESAWARIATPMAGKKMGTYFLPEKNDEVLVAFGDGDIHDPYVVGSLWNGKQTPPRKNDTKNPVRQIASRAGHTITLDDTDDEGNVTIETGAGQTVVVDDAEGAISIEDDNGNVITLDGDGVSIDAGGDLALSGDSIELTAQQDVTISGLKVTGNAKSKLALASKGQLELKSQGMAKLQAQGMTQIKSSAMLQIQGSMIMLN